MEDYQLKVIKEKDELHSKILDLDSILKYEREELNPIEVPLLVFQLRGMKMYSQALRLRIESWEQKDEMV